jgi:hypothetical protein
MSLSSYDKSIVAKWKEFSNIESPAGSLFTSGDHAEADIVCQTGTGSGKCGTVCSGSMTNPCC